MTKIYHTSGCNCGCNDGDKGSNRRDFLKKAGTVTGLGLAFGSLAWAKNDTPKDLEKRSIGQLEDLELVQELILMT